MHPWHNRKGYKVVGLTENGKTTMIPVHKVQELTFLGGPKEGLQIDHIDGNKENNDVTNLRQVTVLENARNPISRCRHMIASRDPERLARISASIRAKYKDEAFHKRMTEVLRNNTTKPGWIANHARAMKEVWSRPEMKKLVYANLERMNGDPEMRAYNALRSKQVNSRVCVATKSNGERLEFPSVTACAEYFGVATETITRYMREDRPNPHGWSFHRPDKKGDNDEFGANTSPESTGSDVR